MTSSGIAVSHRINAERLAVLGWSRAILLQLAHPLVAAGVADHSAFSACPHAAALRLRHTVRAMLSLTFGDDAAVDRTVAGIRGIHARVNGRLGEAVGSYPAGTPYSAEDPDLLLWVHATLVESIVLVYDDLVAPLDVSDRDAFCRDARRAVLALGARPADVPDTWAELVARVEATRRSGAIVVGPDARRLAAKVLSPPMASLAWPLTWANRTLTIGMLPADVRAQYGFSWTARQARQFERARQTLRTARRFMPRAIAWWAAARQVARQPSPDAEDISRSAQVESARLRH